MINDDVTEPTAAHTLARMVRDRIPSWIEENTEDRRWRWRAVDEDYVWIEVDGRDRIFRVLEHQEGTHHGPSVIGFRSGVTVRVDLPPMVDRHDMAGAVAALVAIGALPDEEGRKGLYRDGVEAGYRTAIHRLWHYQTQAEGDAVRVRLLGDLADDLRRDWPRVREALMALEQTEAELED